MGVNYEEQSAWLEAIKLTIDAPNKQPVKLPTRRPRAGGRRRAGSGNGSSWPPRFPLTLRPGRASPWLPGAAGHCVLKTGFPSCCWYRRRTGGLGAAGVVLLGPLVGHAHAHAEARVCACVRTCARARRAPTPWEGPAVTAASHALNVRPVWRQPPVCHKRNRNICARSDHADL